LDARTRIPALGILLDRLHHVPHGEQGDRDAVEGLHLHAGLVRRFDGRADADPILADVEDDARRRNRNRMAMGEDLPDGLHRMESRDLRGREGVALLQAPASDGLDRGRLQADGPFRDGPPPDVRLRADVDHLRHRPREGRRLYFFVAPLAFLDDLEDSVFHIGTICLTWSIAHSHASKASARCAAETAIATDGLPTTIRPSRCTTAISRAPNFALASSAILPICFNAIGR